MLCRAPCTGHCGGLRAHLTPALLQPLAGLQGSGRAAAAAQRALAEAVSKAFAPIGCTASLALQFDNLQLDPGSDDSESKVAVYLCDPDTSMVESTNYWDAQKKFFGGTVRSYRSLCCKDEGGAAPPTVLVVSAAISGYAPTTSNCTAAIAGLQGGSEAATDVLTRPPAVFECTEVRAAGRPPALSMAAYMTLPAARVLGTALVSALDCVPPCWCI
jgi:hypothetical protein